MKAILGCFRTTPTAAIEIEAGLAPTWLRLQTKVLLAITRMQSLSSQHPIYGWIERGLRTRTAAVVHRSNIENILQQFPITTTKLEVIQPFIRAPWWTTRASIQIAAGKDMANTLHDALATSPGLQNAMIIYTDGSGIEGQVGAAAFNMTTSQTSHQYLGSQTKYNVYAAELMALDLAVNQWQSLAHQFSECYVFTDSQASCSSIQKPWRQSGQKIISSILDHMDSILNQNSHCQLRIIWVPGHKGIQGNEQVDEEAKRAALDPTLSSPFEYSPLKSSRVQEIKEMAKEQWAQEWSKNKKTAAHLRRILTKPRIMHRPKLYNSIPGRNMCAKIVQLWTGHCGLNGYLHRFRIKESPLCECGCSKETVEHFLMECRRFKDARSELRRNVGTRKMRVDRLLGDPKTIKYTAEYIKATSRLE